MAVLVRFTVYHSPGRRCLGLLRGIEFTFFVEVHKFLGEMLGIRRGTVSTSTSTFTFTFVFTFT